MDRYRRIPWKMRPDLIVHPSRDGRQKRWTVKDPVTLDYFTMSELEFDFLSSLDGMKSLSDLQDEESISDDGIDREMIEFLNKLISNNLVVRTSIGYGQQVAERARRQRVHFARNLNRFNFIFFRWKGFDPQRLLVGLNSVLSWIYSPYILLSCFILFFCAAIALLRQSLESEFVNLNLQPIFTFQNLPILLLAIVAVKLIHEVAHGLTCVHYGGECHELGVLFVAFFPLLYCDTTDSWLKQDRWQRAQVAGAGMFVELVIASICCLLWVGSVPGVLHAVFLNVMLVCSVNTVLVNGNPLLRYDGYYLLSDLLNVPNLGPDSRQLTQAWLDRVVYGTPVTPGSHLSLKNLGMAGYGLASLIYRIVVLVVIAWAVHQMLKRAGIGELTLIVLAPMLLSLVIGLSVSAIRRGGALAKGPGMIRKFRALIGMAFLGSLLVAICVVPLPYTISVPFSFEPSACRPAYVTVPGRLESIKPAMSRIEVGDVLAELDNPGLEAAVKRTESQLELQKLHLDNLKTFQANSQLISASIPEAAQKLEMTKRRLEAERLMLGRLTLKSPGSGSFFPSRNVPRKESESNPVRFWQGQPQQSANRFAWMNEQTVLGWVGTNEDLRVVAYVPQDQMEFIVPKADARIVFLSAPNESCQGHVSEIGTERVDVLTRELVRNQFASVDPLAGEMKPQETLYRVRLKIESGQIGALYSTGFAKIRCQPASIASRVWRLVSHTFALEL